MTRDVDEYDDSLKIDISLEGDKDSSLEQFFKKEIQHNNSYTKKSGEDWLGALLADKDNPIKQFYEKGLGALLSDPYFMLLYVPVDGTKMHIIRPVTDPYHRKRIIKRINETRKGIPSFYYALSHLWGLSEQNQDLWHDIGQYVDDEEGKPVEHVPMRPEKREPLLRLIKDHPDSYWWIDVLCARSDTPLDIMGDIYSCCLECVAMIDCEPSVISKIHATLDLKNEIEDLCEKHPHAYEQIYQTKGPPLAEPLYPFFQSKWWYRVWTWQEMALPVGDVCFMAETDTHQLGTNSVTLEELLELQDLLNLIKINLNNRNQCGLDVDDRELKLVKDADQKLRDIDVARTSSCYRISERDGVLVLLMASLCSSTRRCMDPADYVYGVLGMLKIKVPRMSDPNAAWRHFLSILDDLYADHIPGSGRFIDLADVIDLQNYETIGEVYSRVVAIIDHPILLKS